MLKELLESPTQSTIQLTPKLNLTPIFDLITEVIQVYQVTDVLLFGGVLVYHSGLNPSDLTNLLASYIVRTGIESIPLALRPHVVNPNLSYKNKSYLCVSVGMKPNTKPFARIKDKHTLLLQEFRDDRTTIESRLRW